MYQRKIALELKKNEDKRKKGTLESIIENHVEKYNAYLDINVDLDNFVVEIQSLTEELNTQLSRRNAIKEAIVRYTNDLRNITELYSIAYSNYYELLGDADYLERSIKKDTIVCPICGTEHSNSFNNRFNLFRDIQECEQLMSSYFDKKYELEKQLSECTADFNKLNEYIETVNSILNRKRDKLAFRDVVLAEGSKSILYDMKKELGLIRSSLAQTEADLKDITKEQTRISKDGRDITDLYLEQLRNYLRLLDVNDIRENDVKKFTASFASGGNDLPCAILAQVYAIAYVAGIYSHTVMAPIVLDAIFQQEPAKAKIQQIFRFLLREQPPETQLIISTTELYGNNPAGKIIVLDRERGLLCKSDYDTITTELECFKALAYDQT